MTNKYFLTSVAYSSETQEVKVALITITELGITKINDAIEQSRKMAESQAYKHTEYTNLWNMGVQVIWLANIKDIAGSHSAMNPDIWNFSTASVYGDLTRQISEESAKLLLRYIGHSSVGGQRVPNPLEIPYTVNENVLIAEKDSFRLRGYTIAGKHFETKPLKFELQLVFKQD